MSSVCFVVTDFIGFIINKGVFVAGALDPWGLTERQAKFVQGVADGKTQIEAYRLAYNTQNMARKSIDQNASRLMNNAKIKSRLETLQKTVAFIATRKMAESVIWTRQMSIDGLASIFTDESAPHSARVAALKEINAMHGFNDGIKLNIGGQKDNPIVIAPDEAGL